MTQGTSSLLQPEEQVLSTLNADGSRCWLRPRVSPGRFLTARRRTAWILIAIFTALPFVKINGKPAMLLDFPARQFTLFGATFLATDTVFLALLLVSIFALIFLVTAFLGRLWCGWACPQTVYLEFVYRAIERIVDGTAGRGGAGRPRGFPRTLLLLGCYLLVSLVLAHTFLAYFVGVDNLRQWLVRSPLEHPGSFLLMAITTAAMMFNFTYFREQTCIVACPYGRLQSVLLDRDSLIISYDPTRGEPRGKGRRTPRDSVALPVVARRDRPGGPSPGAEHAEGRYPRENEECEKGFSHQHGKGLSHEHGSAAQSEIAEGGHGPPYKRSGSAAEPEIAEGGHGPPDEPRCRASEETGRRPVPQRSRTVDSAWEPTLSQPESTERAVPQRSRTVDAAREPTLSQPESTERPIHQRSRTVEGASVAEDFRSGEGGGAATADQRPLGDCIDCGLCVITCPTGIDIRNGLQMECVACAQCIDACDAVMQKIGLPTGLIRYTSQNRLATGAGRLLRGRVFFYAALLTIVGSLLVWSLSAREEADVTLLRGRGTLFNKMPDGRISNSLQIKITNRTAGPQSYHVALANAGDGELLLESALPALAPLETVTVNAVLLLSTQQFEAGRAAIDLLVTSEDGYEHKITHTAIGPR